MQQKRVPDQLGFSQPDRCQIRFRKMSSQSALDERTFPCPGLVRAPKCWRATHFLSWANANKMAAHEDPWRTRTSKREKVKEMYPYIIQYTQQSGVPAGNEFARITFVRMEDRIAVPGIYMCDTFLERKKVGFSRTHGTFWSNEVTEGYPSKVKLNRNKERKPPLLYSRKGDATQRVCASTHSYCLFYNALIPQYGNTDWVKYWCAFRRS